MKKGIEFSKESRALTNRYSSYLYQPWLYPGWKTDKYNIPVPSEEAVDEARAWEIENKL